MNSEAEPKLDLAWLEIGGRRDPALDFEAGDAAGGALSRYTAALWVCSESRCGCYGVCFDCRPAMPEGSPAPADLSREFWMDVWDRSVATTPELENDRQTARLAEGVRARLSDAA